MQGEAVLLQSTVPWLNVEVASVLAMQNSSLGVESVQSFSYIELDLLVIEREIFDILIGVCAG